MNIVRRVLLPFCLSLGACMPVTPSDVPTRAVSQVSDLPAIKTFATPRPSAPIHSNSDIARDFLDLAFQLESGRNLPVLTKFHGPITVRVTGAPTANMGSDLNRLLHRLRTEANIDIRLSPQPNANITIEAVTRAQIRRQLPQAACFVVPNVSSLNEYQTAKRSQKVNWSRLTERKRLAIFLPNDSSPQEVRDCLHEELAQALGPLNDLYRLPDSVFNDDNVHTVLTGFDMLILKAYYDPSLRNGMSRTQVADRLPLILSRINPAGNGRSNERLSRTPRVWIEAIQAALGPGTRMGERQRAAQEAMQVASAMGWQDHRRAFSHYALGRLAQASDPFRAQEHFLAAETYYQRSNGTTLHRAYVASQLAAFAISAGEPEQALRAIGQNQTIAAKYENAALLSTLMLLRAEALEMVGRVSEAREVRLDSLGWARYGFGPEWAVRAKVREIGALSPLKRGMGRL